MATRRDWAELNPELLHLIAKKLGNLSNFIRFRSVCKQWRAAADPADPPPQLPWILHPEKFERTGFHTNTDYNLYCPSSDSTTKVKLPVTYREYRYFTFKEPSVGFLLADVSDQTQFDQTQTRVDHPYLYNPLTKEKIHLPFTKYVRYSLVYMGLSNKSNSSTVKSGVHMIVYSHMRGQTEIGSWRSDTNKFITFKVPIRTPVVGYYKGKVFVYDEVETRKTSVFDLTTGAEMNVGIPHPAECLRLNFFVEAMGDLLAVECLYRGEGECDNHQFKVYRLEHTDDFGQCRWIKLKGTGERILFLGRAPGGLCLSASDFEGVRGNCIYYMEPCNKGGFQDYNCVLRYDMEKGTSQELPIRVACSATWFLPCLC